MTAFRKERLQGLSCLKGNFHEQFLGGWAGAIPPGYPAKTQPSVRNDPARAAPRARDASRGSIRHLPSAQP